MRVEYNDNVSRNYTNGSTTNTRIIRTENEPAITKNISSEDTVSFSKPESFYDVLEEMRANVPDRTTTIEEKELAISYIDRLLACPDITPEIKSYWENKKIIIQNEIQTIINEKCIGNDNNLESLENEFWEYSNTVWNRPVSFNNIPDRVEYWVSYYNTCITYIDRILNCDGLTEEKQAEYQQLRNNMLFDLNNHKTDLNRYNAEHGTETESFYNVFNEMRRNVPDRTTTIPEKLLALSYIDRMLSCDDISVMQKAFWMHQRRVIENELENFEK